MKSRDLGVLLFGLTGLYTLLLALLGLAQLLAHAPRSGAIVAGQLQVQATFVNGMVSVLLHLVFGIALFAGRRTLANRLLGDEDAPAAAVRPDAGERAKGIAAAGVCAVAILLIARVVTALSYATSLLLIRDHPGDLVAWTLGGILIDLLLAAAGWLLIARRDRVAARLLAVPGTAAVMGVRDGELPWQLPAMRFLGLALLVWHLPQLASALSVFVKWQLRPLGFDLRTQALTDIPAATTAVIAGLYLWLLFPAGLTGLRGVWRRDRPRHDIQPR